eukprot:1157027-Pelagomonas_calceolata.AAC.2
MAERLYLTNHWVIAACIVTCIAACVAACIAAYVAVCILHNDCSRPLPGPKLSNCTSMSALSNPVPSGSVPWAWGGWAG